MRHRSAAVALWLLGAACSGEEPEEIPEACEHMDNGPSINITNGGTVLADHRRYDISIQPGRSPSGAVLFNVPSAGRWFFYENKNIPVRARLNGIELTIVATVQGKAAGACSAAGIRTEMQLEAGVHEMNFAETFESIVSLVIEPRANVP